MIDKNTNNVMDLFNQFKEKFQDNLLYFQPVFEDLLDNSWINLILVFDVYDYKVSVEINKIIKLYSLKINVMCYSYQEFSNKLIDAKTYYYLYLTNYKYIDILYKNIEIPHVGFSEVKREYISLINNDISNLKLYLAKNICSHDKLFLSIYMIMYELLVINKRVIINSYDVFKNFFSMYNELNFDYTNANVNIKKYAIKFIDYISNNIEKRINNEFSIQILNNKNMFKYRVSLIIKNGDMVLFNYNSKNNAYGFIGGYAEYFENSIDTIKRECLEETGLDIPSCDFKYFGSLENFFINKNMEHVHEISLFYIVNTSLSTNDFEYVEHERHNDIIHQYKWVNINKLKEIKLKPLIVKEKLIKNDDSIFHEISRD